MTKLTPRFGVLTYVLVIAGFSFFNKTIGLITDYAWFKELDLTSVFKVSFVSMWGWGLLAGLLAAAAMLLNLKWARRNARHVIILSENEQDLIGFPASQWRHLSRPLLMSGSLIAAFLVASWAGSEWETILKFLNATPFGHADPIFNKDIGFYVFSLPFYNAVSQFLRSVVILCALLTAATYIIEGALVVTNRGIKMAESVKNHLVLLAGVLCLLVAVYFQLNIYNLLQMERTVAPGPGYADLHAYLPILRLLPFVAVASALLCWMGLFQRNARWAMGGVALLVLGSVGANVARGITQRLFVAPNEIVKETPYIKHAIEYTRKAYGIDHIQELEFDPNENLSQQGLRRNAATINNIRLWDHAPLLRTYSQLQEIRTYYEFMDVDNDRYKINGELRQVMLSPRELNPDSLPSRIWINEHLTYTHGYGLTLGPVNKISPEGLPEFFIKDIPPQATDGFRVTRPEIYFGEAGGSYVIVNTKSKEFDYPSGDENIYTQYAGSGGVPVSGLIRKLLFALRFKEPKILLSSDFTPESKILYFRNIQERLRKAAPFLRFDQDPYLVISKEGRLFWMVDAYTVTDQYPYSASLRGVGNYIRNSVKAVVDAYHGSVDLYVADESDPIIQTYRKIFPNVLKTIDKMPEDLREHIRYPQDLFSIQAYMYATYHMTDPQVFYNKEDLWKIPERTAGGTSKQRMEPYYTVTKLASIGEKEEFILMAPFTPARKENMIAWLAARCDAPNYGKLLVYNFPKQKLVYGPQQIDSRINQDAVISQQLTLWNQGGSQVIRGSLLVIPVESSLLYVQPLYLEAARGGLPELKRVIVAYGNAIVMEETLEDALQRIFSGRVEGSKISIASPAAAGDNIRSLSRQAQTHFERAQQRLRQDDWAGYGAEMNEVKTLLKKLAESQP